MLIALIFTALAAANNPALDKLLPESKPFTEYLKQSGEQPPDFNSLPPDARVRTVCAPLLDGKIQSITAPEAWRTERQRLLGLMQQWFFGTYPPPPEKVEAVLKSENRESGALRRDVELRFGPENKAKLNLELYLPDGPGPFPVFMTQDNHRMWAMLALQRGYAAVVYAGADSRDDTDSFLEAYPGYDWSRLLRRGWAAGRCIDYLQTLPEIDLKHIAVAGHSRNGKTSLMAAALDERIAAVISSSSGVGGCMPSRECGEHQFAEGIENITNSFPEWFHPRWRFFAGREHLAPVDMQQLVALAAPRACLLSIAENDGVENGWAMQRSYLAAKPAWALHGAEDALRILWRPFGHETTAATIERYLDWCDTRFGRARHDFPEVLPFPWDWTAWNQAAESRGAAPVAPAEVWDAPARQVRRKDAKAPANTREAVRTMLGVAPPDAKVANMDYGLNQKHTQVILARPEPGPGLEWDAVMFGDYIYADIYLPKGAMKAEKKLPAILWLPPHCVPRGYGTAYRRGEQPYRSLAQAGYAVFCFDPIGTGARIREIDGFYDRYPRWSVLGKMLRDDQAALDAMAQLPYVDPDRIYVAGYAQGAFAALHLAALDARPAGYMLVAAPLPFRLDTDSMLTGGVLRWAQDSMLLPQLGRYAGREDQIPYDLDDLAACIAPKPLLILHPDHDRFAPEPQFQSFADTLHAIYAARDVKKALRIETPTAYNHFDETMQKTALNAWAGLVGKAK